MNLEFSNRAIADLRKAAADSYERFGPSVALSLEQRMREAIAHIAEHPERRRV